MAAGKEGLSVPQGLVPVPRVQYQEVAVRWVFNILHCCVYNACDGLKIEL